MLCAFPVHLWSILNFLYEVPAMLVRMNTSDLLTIFTYTQVFALVESFILFLILVSLGIFLPPRLLKDRPISQGALIIFLVSCWAVLIHLHGYLRIKIIDYLSWVALWTIFIGFYLVITYRWLTRFKKLVDWIEAISERIIVLTTIYIFIDMTLIVLAIGRSIYSVD